MHKLPIVSSYLDKYQSLYQLQITQLITNCIAARTKISKNLKSGLRTSIYTESVQLMKAACDYLHHPFIQFTVALF